MKTHHIRRGRSGTLVVAIGAVLTIALTACGSSSNGSTSGAGVDKAGLAAAKKASDAALARPTQIPISTPITKPIPKGKKIVFLSAGTTTSDLEYGIIKQAAAKLGWTVSELPSDGSPEQSKSDWDQIVRTKPDGVIYSATPDAYFKSELAQAAKEGIQVVATSSTDPIGGGLKWVISTTAQSVGTLSHPAAFGLLADYMIAQSGGSAHALLVGLPTIPIIKAVTTAFDQTVSKNCPSACHVDELDVPLTSLGKDVSTRVVAALRAHPQDKWVVLSIQGAMDPGLPAAIRAAGLSGIHIIGDGPTVDTFQYIAAGQEEATATFPYYEEMYALVDALARLFTGTPLTPASKTVVPNWIVTAKTLPTSSAIFPVVADNEAQWEKLWGLS